VFIIARLHSGKKGKSGTKRPKTRIVPEWSELKKAEIQEIAIRLAKERIPPAKIGLILRDEYAVPEPRAVFGMGLSEFLRSEGALPELPEDLLNLMKKIVRMQEHLKRVKKDTANKVKMSHVESKIARLVKHYTKEGMLPAGWKYDREKVALLVK
jgi:small subunit ribosomal protein S15